MILEELARETAILITSFKSSVVDKQFIIKSNDSVKRWIEYGDEENDFMMSNYDHSSLALLSKQIH